MRLLRFLPLVAGLGFLWMASWMWRFGEPPPWSFVAERIEVVVTTSRVDVERIGNGTLRYTPVVEVDPGDGDPAPIVLAGVVPSFFEYGPRDAEEIAALYRVGATIEARPLDGVLFADRNDLFHVGLSSFMTVMSLFVTFIGLLVAGVPMRFVGRLLGAGRGARDSA